MHRSARLFTIITDERSFVVSSDDAAIVRAAIDQTYESFRVTAIKVDDEPDARVEIRTCTVRGIIRHETPAVADVIPFPSTVQTTTVALYSGEMHTSPALV